MNQTVNVTRRFAALGAALAIVISACSSAATPSPTAPPSAPASVAASAPASQAAATNAQATTAPCGTVNIAVNPWVGYEANAAVVGYVLQHELGCTVVYVIPRTSILGAILLTGYLGGATATHVRVGDEFFAPVIVGVLVWGGLFLREPRLCALIPLRHRPE